MEIYRDRKHCLLLYPEDATHVEALEIIKRTMDYAVVLHDKDKNADGTDKKPHWHVAITTGNNPKWNSALSKELGIEPNYIEKPRNLDRALEYLIHYNDIEKHQYSIDDVQGSLKKRLLQNINASDKTEGEKISEILEMIELEEYKITYMCFTKWIQQHGYWDVYRRAGAIINKVLDEHNDYVEMENRMKRQEAKRLREEFRNVEDINEETPFESEDK